MMICQPLCVRANRSKLMWRQIMELLSLIVPILIFIGTRFVFSPAECKGHAGERKVAIRSGKLVGKIEGCKVFNNVILPTPDGTTQIDHILLSPQGIFAIETKNMTGWIFGGERQKRWTQIIYRKKIKFQNPVHQNYKHVKALENLLGSGQKIKKIMFNVVVFAGDARFKTSMPDNVVKSEELWSYINSRPERVINKTDFDKYRLLIERAVSCNQVSDKDHVRNVERNRRNPVCPRCGCSMVLRTAKKGKNKGSVFWGCSDFPSCRAIRETG